MYEILLFLHSWNRWLVVILGLLTLGICLRSLSHTNAYAQLKKTSLFFMIFLDLQLLIGLILYFMSPLISSALANKSLMMKDPVLRYWGIEHFTTMLIAIVVIHVGRVMAKKAESERKATMRILISTVIWLILVLAAMPWPSLMHGRPLFRI